MTEVRTHVCRHDAGRRAVEIADVVVVWSVVEHCRPHTGCDEADAGRRRSQTESVHISDGTGVRRVRTSDGDTGARLKNQRRVARTVKKAFTHQQNDEGRCNEQARDRPAVLSVRTLYVFPNLPSLLP